MGTKAVTLVDTEALRVSGIDLLDGIVGGGDHPFELAVTQDRRRAFVHYPAEDKVAVLDLEQRKAIGSAKTGRGGKKIFNSMMSTLTYGASERTFFYNAGDPPQMQVRPDGRFAYVLNLDTSDVTIVDADTAQAVEKIGASGREVLRLGEKTILVVGSEIHVIDAARNVKAGQIQFPGLRGLVTTPDGAFAVALAERTVLILDGATGKERARRSPTSSTRPGSSSPRPPHPRRPEPGVGAGRLRPSAASQTRSVTSRWRTRPSSIESRPTHTGRLNRRGPQLPGVDPEDTAAPLRERLVGVAEHDDRVAARGRNAIARGTAPRRLRRRGFALERVGPDQRTVVDEEHRCAAEVEEAPLGRPPRPPPVDVAAHREDRRDAERPSRTSRAPTSPA